MGTVVIGPVGKYFAKEKSRKLGKGRLIRVGRVEGCIPSLIPLI